LSRADDIIERIDAGLGRAHGWSVPIRSNHCGRAGCVAAPVDGHDFCQPCLDWLRDDSTAASAGQRELPDDDAPNPEPVDAIVAWVELHGGIP
jgi:hypothetical protein